MPSYQCRGKKKLWSVRFVLIENGKETQKRLSGFEKKKDAESSYVAFMQAFHENQKQTQPDKDILERNFGDVFNEYLEYKKDKVKISTFYDLEKLADKHIIPYFCGQKIKKINKQIILSWQTSLNNLNYSYKYKQKIRGILYSFFKYLYFYYDIDNVVARVEAFTKPNSKREMEFWTIDEFNKFISTTDDNITFKTFFTYLYYTGCRLGEALALNFKDIDLSTKRVNINKSITTKVYKTENKKTYAIVSPKNQSSFRKIKMPDILINQLKQYVESMPQIKNELFLFGGEKPLDDHTIYRYFETHCKLANVKRIRIHDLRHSHASLLIQNGANVVLVAKRLGHSSTEQTLNTYAHLFPSTEQELIDKLNAL